MHQLVERGEGCWLAYMGGFAQVLGVIAGL